ncbi:MAG: hypothetical protein VXY77_00560 [Pseudomonadota bacterium]|nr:hypothetical protein [Pseudomonadota bacterium]
MPEDNKYWLVDAVVNFIYSFRIYNKEQAHLKTATNNAIDNYTPGITDSAKRAVGLGGVKPEELDSVKKIMRQTTAVMGHYEYDHTRDEVYHPIVDSINAKDRESGGQYIKNSLTYKDLHWHRLKTGNISSIAGMLAEFVKETFDRHGYKDAQHNKDLRKNFERTDETIKKAADGQRKALQAMRKELAVDAAELKERLENDQTEVRPSSSAVDEIRQRHERRKMGGMRPGQ